MLRVAFYVGKGDIVDKLIRFRTGERESHCELVFSDDYWFSSSTRYADEYRTRFKKIVPTNGNWEFIEIPLDDADEYSVRYFCELQQGKLYDFLGIAFSQALEFNIHDKNKWFCSEICSAALQKPSLIEVVAKEIQPNQLNPGEFRAYLLAKGFKYVR